MCGAAEARMKTAAARLSALNASREVACEGEGNEEHGEGEGDDSMSED